jgi:hypothetical protein
MPLAEVEVGKLAEVVWVSLVAGVGVTTVFSLVVYSGARAGEARREGRSGAATAFGVLAGLALLGFLAGVTIGVSIMLNK